MALQKFSLLSAPSVLTYLVSLLVGCLYALIVPTLSVFLANELQVRPVLIGLFFVSMALTAIVYGQSIALWSDKFADRRLLIALGMVAGGFACFGFAYSRSFATVLLTAVTLFSLSFIAAAQMVALSREYADQYLPANQNRIFNSAVRACIAFAWMLGPPLGFGLMSWVGFSLHYTAIGIGYFIVAIVAFFLLPKVKKVELQDNDEVPNNRRWIIFVAAMGFSFLYAANQCYLVTLPLFLEEGLAVSSSKAGWIFGTAAGLEIPFMIFAGWLGGRYPLMPLIRVGAVSAIVLNLGVWHATDLWQLFSLQIFNAVFIGFVAGLGMSWFQDELPGRTGTASTLYLNCMNLGNVIGSIFFALFAELYGYREIFAVNVSICALALILFIFVNHRK
ncbi:sugar efflux transporter [Teredinibacter haidensis]|uniref:sugar efflux transporter n=1 Tax=Teredinibacter haidensis TaxID=2731755 RepID=UPI0009F9D2FD|nr:sugar efflux transporter [Teredinibacter haidensis]